MKKLLLVSSFLIAQQSYACIMAGNSYICTGDTVYKGDAYSQGATVVSENTYTGQVTVRSRSSGNLFSENARDLDVTNGCLGNFCVNEKIFKGNYYSQGATIVAYNTNLGTLTVKSLSSGNLARERAEDVDYASGCFEDICVGDLLYKGNYYSQGAKVLAYNHYKRTLTVKSLSSGNMSSELKSDMYIAKGCLGNVCVGDRVFKGNSYSQGATVLAINAESYRATIRSISSGNLAAESIYDLQGGSNYPTPNPWPQPQPPRPRPEPRPPVPSYVECTVNRLDPSGLFITSYVGAAYTMGEACRIATNDCARDIKGRQTCNIVR